MKNIIKYFNHIIIIAIFCIVFAFLGIFLLNKYLKESYCEIFDLEYDVVEKIYNENKKINGFVEEYKNEIAINKIKNLSFLLRENISKNGISEEIFDAIGSEKDINNSFIIDYNNNVFSKNNVNINPKTYIDEIKNNFEKGKKFFVCNDSSDTKKIAFVKINNEYIYGYFIHEEDDDKNLVDWNEIIENKKDYNTNSYIILDSDDKIVYNNTDKNYEGKITSYIPNYNNMEYDKWVNAKFDNVNSCIRKTNLDGNNVIIVANTKDIMEKSLNFMFFVFLVFLICLIFLNVYSSIVSEEEILFRESLENAENIKILRANKNKKICIVSFSISIIMVLAMIFFVIVSICSNSSEYSNIGLDRISRIVVSSEKCTNQLYDIHSEFCKLNNNFIKDSLIKNSDLINKDGLARIAKGLEVDEIRILGLDGETICTNKGLDKFKLSKDKENDTYKCWDLLQEEGFIILPIQYNIDGNPYQYACTTLRNIDNDVVGIIMTKYDVSEITEAEVLMQWKNTLQLFGASYIVYDNKKDKVLLSSFEKFENLSASDDEIVKKISKPGYEGYLKLDNSEYYVKSKYIGDSVFGCFVSIKEIYDYYYVIIIIIIILVLILIFIYTLLMLKLSDKYQLSIINLKTNGNNIKQDNMNFDLSKIIVTQWDKITGTQKISLLIYYLFIFLMIVFSITYLFGKNIFGEYSSINYIINGTWEKSFNIIAITKGIMIVSCVTMVSVIMISLLKFILKSFDARGVTICKLIINFIRYATIFICFYQCLMLIGVDTKTLLASAGILSLIVGFGANKLIQEVVAGLFIIFEGAFQVGDNISIGNKFSGTVKEIGIRTTQVYNKDGDVLIISNSSLNDVVNHSTAKSLLVYDYKISRKIPIEICDKYFNEKIDYLKKQFEGIIKEIKYEGLVNYEVENYTIRFSIYCIEEKLPKVDFSIDNEMKKLIDELSNNQ